MQLSINHKYAQRYNECRRKEEFQKLRDRYGDISLLQPSCVHLTHADAAVQSDSEDSSERNESSFEENDSNDDREHDDFLVLYDALCRNDPSLKDPNRHWFRPTIEKTSSRKNANKSQEMTDQNLINGQHTAVKLRDFQREFLLTRGGLEDESVAADASRMTKLDSDKVLSKLSLGGVDDSKNAFLTVSNSALKALRVSTEDTPDFLHRRVVQHNMAEENPKVNINVDNLQFTDNANIEAEQFLRDFIVNRRWKRLSPVIPTYVKILSKTQVDDRVQSDTNSECLNDANILDEDDEFLTKVHDFEVAQQVSTLDLTKSVDKVTAKHRFEEMDREFIKSYPRKIHNTMHQATTDGTSVRATKREARRARKAETKRARLAELQRMRLLKLSMLANKISRIQRSSGAGSVWTSVNLDELCATSKTGLDNATTLTQAEEVVMDLAMHLDEDWIPEKHNELLDRVFNRNYYEAHEDAQHTPRFSDSSDLNSDTEYSTLKEGNNRKQKNREVHRGDYFDSHYKHTCEDIIPGPSPDEDLICRFHYRQVKPNDYGLSIEEVLTASTRELNHWVPMNLVTGYRTEAEERHDQKLYHSKRRLRNKTSVLPSLTDPNAHWWPEEAELQSSTLSGDTKRNRLRKKRNKLLHMKSLSCLVSQAEIWPSEHYHADEQTPSKRAAPATKRIKGVGISAARMAASGIKPKDIYRYRKSSNKLSTTSFDKQDGPLLLA